MNLPFLFLLTAAGIFRFLSADFNKSFYRRLSGLLPRNVMDGHFRVLIEEFPERLGDFRRRVLPYRALYVALNAAACGCFVLALWHFPPVRMDLSYLAFLQYGSALVTSIALLADAILLARILRSTFGRAQSPDAARGEGSELEIE